VTAGAGFHDASRELTAVREQLSWYPRDVWLWIMASAWQRVQDNEPAAGRTAELKDELGNRLVTAKLIGHLISCASFRSAATPRTSSGGRRGAATSVG